MRRTKTEALETRMAILDAAEMKFYDAGVARTTLSQIADAARVTRGAVYFHFRNKNALFFEVVNRSRFPQQCFLQILSAGESDDPLRQLYTCASEALSFIKRNKRAQRVMTIMLLRCEYVGEMEEALQLLQKADEEMRMAAVAALENAARQRLLSSDWEPQAASIAIHSQIGGLIAEWLRSPDAFDIEAVGLVSLKALFGNMSTVRKPIAAAV